MPLRLVYTRFTRVCDFQVCGFVLFYVAGPYGSTNVTHVLAQRDILENFNICSKQMNFCRFLQLATAHLLTPQPSIKISFFPLETSAPYAITLCIWVEGFFFSTIPHQIEQTIRKLYNSTFFHKFFFGQT